MSGWTDLLRLSCVAMTSCPTYHASWFSDFFVALDYWPVALWFMLFAIRSWTGELYIACLNSALTVEYAINLGLRYAFRKPPPDVGCGAQYEMPSFASEHAAFLVVMALLAIVQWSRTVRWYRAALAAAFLVLVVYARVHLAYNSPQQLLAGGGFGVLFGVISHWIIVLFVAPHGDDIVRAAPAIFGLYSNNVMKEIGDPPGPVLPAVTGLVRAQ
jgi:hypothetical protein